VLWFGNALSNNLILPRHGEGPAEQVAGGRMFIEGPDGSSAADKSPVLDLTFTPKVGEPLICGVELIEAGK